MTLSKSRQDLPAQDPLRSRPLWVLRKEFADQGIGPALIAEVRRSARRTAPRYVATKYSAIGNWTHGLDDLVQDVISDALLRDGQAEYMLQVSSTLEDLRTLLNRQTRRVLARHRRRTVIDTVLGRARPILAAPPFAVEDRHGKPAYRLADRPVELRAAKLPELSSAADAIRDIPTVPQRGNRASMVYRTDDLAELLHRISSSLPCVFTIRELDRILEFVLTPFLPSVLDLITSFGEDNASGIPFGTAEAEVIAATLTTAEAVVLALKAGGVADAVIANQLRVSRPTAARTKLQAFEKVRVVLGDCTDEVRLAAIDALGVHTRRVLAGTLPGAMSLAMYYP